MVPGLQQGCRGTDKRWKPSPRKEDPGPDPRISSCWKHGCCLALCTWSRGSHLLCPTIPQQGCLPRPRLCCSSKVHVSSCKCSPVLLHAVSCRSRSSHITSALCRPGVSAELGQPKPRAQHGCSHSSSPAPQHGGAVLTARCLQLTAPLTHPIARLPSFPLPLSGPEQSSKEGPHPPPAPLPLCLGHIIPGHSWVSGRLCYTQRCPAPPSTACSVLSAKPLNTSAEQEGLRAEVLPWPRTHSRGEAGEPTAPCSSLETYQRRCSRCSWTQEPQGGPTEQQGGEAGSRYRNKSIY